MQKANVKYMVLIVFTVTDEVVVTGNKNIVRLSKSNKGENRSHCKFNQTLKQTTTTVK